MAGMSAGSGSLSSSSSLASLRGDRKVSLTKVDESVNSTIQATFLEQVEDNSVEQLKVLLTLRGAIDINFRYEFEGTKAPAIFYPGIFYCWMYFIIIRAMMA